MVARSEDGFISTSDLGKHIKNELLEKYKCVII